ncbi:hypothetical protein EJB05_22243, partial [Eragrostis curvula]
MNVYVLESTEAAPGDGLTDEQQHKSSRDLENNLVLDDEEPADQACINKYDVHGWSNFDDSQCMCISLPPDQDPFLCLVNGPPNVTDDTMQEARSLSSTSCNLDKASTQDSGQACMGVDREPGIGEGMHMSVDDDDDDIDFDREIASKGEAISEEEANSYLWQLTSARSPAHYWVGGNRYEYYRADPDELDKINVSLAWYRIKAYELSKWTDIDDWKLKERYPNEILEENQFFVGYEEDLDWVFHPEHIILSGLDDYQRLAAEYMMWKEYRLIFSDYASDKEYVEYCIEMSKKLKWIKSYVHMPEDSLKWTKLRNKAIIQALKIATGYPHIFPTLIWQRYTEYFWRLRADHAFHDTLHAVCFEVWKLVAKEKKQFRDAFKEVHSGYMFPVSSDRLNRELSRDQDDDDSIEHQFNTYVAGIPETAPENEVHEKIVEAIRDSALRIDGYDRTIETSYIKNLPGLIDKITIAPGGVEVLEKDQKKAQKQEGNQQRMSSTKNWKKMSTTVLGVAFVLMSLGIFVKYSLW